MVKPKGLSYRCVSIDIDIEKVGSNGLIQIVVLGGNKCLDGVCRVNVIGGVGGERFSEILIGV